MGSVYRETYTKPVPAGAELFTSKGQPFARIKPAKGRTQSHPVTVGRDGAPRIVKTAGTYTAKYRDAAGIVQKVATGCRDEGAARSILNELERRAELVRAGVLSASEDAIADHSGAPLGEHLETYRVHQQAKELSSDRIFNTRSRLTRLARECEFRRLRDFNADSLIRWLRSRHDEGMSAGTRNEYRQELVGFGNWCIRTQRLEINPFTSVPRANAKADQRRKRRSLTENEVERLLYVTQHRPLAELGRPVKKIPAKSGARKRSNWKREPLTIENMNEAIIRARAALAEAPNRVRRLEWCGRERGLIYRTLLLTGLRRGELASLKIGSIEIDGPTPHAVLAAEDEKNRKGSTIPLRSDLVVELRSWISDKQEAFSGPRRAFLNEPLFSVPKKLTKVLNRDIEVAGIPKKDERGRTVDVHAMRMTFATLLSKGGVAPKVAQIALRHSDIRLTMQTYTDSKLFDIAGALDSLPPLSLNGIRKHQSEATCATATDPVLVPVLVPTVGHQEHSESSAVTLTGDLGSPIQLSHTEENTPKPTKKALSDEESDGLLQVGATRHG